MNRTNFFSITFIFLLAIISFASFKPLNDGGAEQIKVLMLTNFGVIKIKLYNETPRHRDNFVKLIKAHYYDSLLFHRVIQNFMIQGGDPDSKRAAADSILGNGGPDYTIPAEFNQKLFHKKGVIAAARDGDLDNPLQASSGSQFNIVKLFNEIINRSENKSLLEIYKRVAKANIPDSVKFVNDSIDKQLKIELPAYPAYTFSEEQIKAYTTVGGTPHLDGSYTVFGEVYDGFEVIDDIAKEKTGRNNRPIKDVRIISISIIP